MILLTVAFVALGCGFLYSVVNWFMVEDFGDADGLAIYAGFSFVAMGLEIAGFIMLTIFLLQGRL
jgi:hypothetical protein